MRTRAFALCSLVLLTLAVISSSACHGPKKSRYNLCPAFSKGAPTEKPVAQKHG